MADSLLIDGRFELLGGGQKSTLPQCAGAVFRLAPGFDLSAPQPTTTTVISLLLDGERPVGERASNRTVTLPLIIMADDRTTLAAAVETLLQAIDQDEFKMIWTRSGGVPVVFDCFRATPTTVNYNLIAQQSSKPVQALSISFPALPYLHSDTPITLTFDSPFVGTVAPPSSVELDNYSTVSGAGWSQSTEHVLDSHSAFWSDDNGGYPTYSAAVSSADISALSAVTFWLGLATSFNDYWSWNGGNVTFSVTLTDSAGDTVTFGNTAFCASSNTPGTPNWQQITIPLPDDNTFDWGAVTAYQVSCWSRAGWFGRIMQADVYLNALTVAPASASTPASTRGWLATLYGIQGAARTPLAVQFQLLANGITTNTYTTAGDFTTPVIPAGVTQGKVKLWAPGGKGADLTGAGQGGAGSGGGFAEHDTYPLVAGNTYTGHVGAGGSQVDTTFDLAGTGVRATAGTNATAGSSTGAVATDTSTAPIHHKGGDGGSGAGSGAGTPTLIQSKQFTFTGNSGSGSLTSPTTAGNCLAVMIETYGETDNPTSISSVTLGGAADHFTQAESETSNFTPPACFAWVDKNCAGGQTAIAIATAGASGTVHTTVTVMEWANVDTASPVDKVANGQSSSTSSFNSGTTATTTQANEVFIGAVAGFGVTTPTLTGPASPWTNFTQQNLTISGGGVMASLTGYKVVAATGTASYSGSMSAETGGYNALVITLKGGASSAAGGGGSSAGTASDGNPGTGPTGGSAPTGGAAGANAPATAGNGNPGSAPGGGGSGALSTGAAQTGGQGGDGKAEISYASTVLASFKTLVAHIPGPNAPASLIPFVSVGNGADTPNGAAEYAVQSVAPGVNARFGGTYSLLLVANTLSSPSTSRTVTITIKEYEYTGGPATTTTVARTFVPNTTGANGDLTSGLNGFVALGEATLPARDIAPDNTASYFTVTVNDTITADRWLDLLFIDTSGQLVLCNLGSGYLNYFVDVPDTTNNLGRVLGSQGDRNQAASVLGNAIVSGGPLLVNPGTNTMLVYAVEGAPSMVATYRPAYRVDRPS